MRTVYKLINIFRAIPIFLIIEIQSKRQEIFDELFYWGKCLRNPVPKKLLLLTDILSKYPEYRNLLAHRLRFLANCMVGNIIINILWPRDKSILIFTEKIGMNFFIQHGVSTVIAAESIGDYCWINQQVTIGYDFSPCPPRIGNGVRISCGAKVIGDITIGDNAIIGAGAVVIRDVGENEIVVGVPSHKIGENKDHILFKK